MYMYAYILTFFTVILRAVASGSTYVGNWEVVKQA